MDNQDHRKNHAPGESVGHENHGVHACNKCGWPFPNPHPSAKHRRAHKKICGSIDGYKFVDSEDTSLLPVSDDDHHSDEDRTTPSPQVLQRSKNEEDTTGMGGRTNRSEEEMFSDAVTEFADSGSSLSMEEHPGNVKKSASNMEMVNTVSRLDEESAINVVIPPPSDPADSSSQVQNAEFPRCNLSESAEGLQHDVSHAAIGLGTTSSTDGRTEKFAYELPDDKISFACDSNPIKLETQTHASQGNKKKDAGEVLIEIEGQRREGTSIDIQLKDGMASPKDKLKDGMASPKDDAGKAFVVMPVDVTSDPSPATGVLQMKGELTNELGSKMSSNNLPCEAKPIEHMNATILADQIQVDTAAVMDAANSGSSIGGNDGKEDEDMIVFSIPGVVPAVGDAEAMIIGFKDHKGGKLPQLVDVESFEVINDAKHFIPDDNPSSFNSSQLNEDAEVSESGMYVLKDNLERKGGSSESVEQLPVEEEAEINNTVNDNQRLEEVRTLTDTGAFESDMSSTFQSLGEHVAPDYCNNSCQTNSLGHATKVLSDANPVASPADAGVSQESNSLGKDDNGKYEKENIERCDVVGNDNDEKFTEYSSQENIISMSEPASINGRINLIGNDNAADKEADKIEQYKASGNEIGEDDSSSGLAEEKLLGKLKSFPGSASDLHLASEDAINASEVKLPEPEFGNLDRVLDTQDCVKELGTCGDEKVQTDCINRVSIATEVEVLLKPVDDQVMKEPQTSLLDASSSIKNPFATDDNHARDFSGVVSGNKSESLTDENIVVQQLGASATDFSVDSSSQTDSLEGHWGSVSVLSTQSDIPAVVGPEPLLSLGSRASAEDEKTSLKEPKAALMTQHSDKSDIFEAPSFMTLVEPTRGDQNAAGSEILTQKGQQQGKATSVQAGWFPSITHVVNESQGRKKNEEIIAKVTNWSAGKQHTLKGQPHTPLKSLLVEANIESKSKSPNSKANPAPVVDKDGTTAKDCGTSTAKVSSILGPEVLITEPTKKEEGKEWKARYPTEIKGEKRKVKRPYWAQLMCCSSVN